MLSLALTLGHAATPLTDYQQRALEQMLATMDPATRALVRPQLELSISVLDEQGIQMLLASMSADGNDAPYVADESEAAATASAEDLAFNRSQWEPALRDAWQASHRFDTAVDAALSLHCPEDRRYAVWGQAWRYEVMELRPRWSRASASADVDVEILGAAAAPQDGRYRFDFSALNHNVDIGAVDRAVAAACARYRDIGEDFLVRAKAGMRDDYLPDGMKLEGAANAAVATLLRDLEETLVALTPSGSAGVMNAMFTTMVLY